MIRGILLAGGTGTRIWPLSRKESPKQLLKLFDNKVMLKTAIDLLEPVVDSVIISTGKNLEKQTKKLFPNYKIIAEPDRRDTTAAIGYCVSQFDGDDTLVIMASDGYIKPEKEFQKNIQDAIKLADKGIVIVGVKPTFPSTALGYIEPGKNNRVNSFKEKPDEKTAKQFVKDGYLWNICIFVAKAKIFMEEFKRQRPKMYEKLIEIKETGKVEEIYPTMEKIAIDYAIMENAKDVFYVPATFYWNDVGGFKAIHEIIGKENSSIQGKLETVGSKGNVVYSNKKDKLIALIDCENLAVIDTADALLVCPKETSAKLKEFVETLDEKLK